MWNDRFEGLMKVVVALGIAVLVAGFLLDPINILGHLGGSPQY